MAIIAYARVSSVDQNLDRQLDALQQYDPEKVFTEKMSGRSANRPQLQAMMDYIREGDTLIVEFLSRLGRSTRNLLELMDQLRDKGVHVKFLKENLDTSTASGRMMFTVMAALAQFEREIMHERQAEGIAAARSRGKHLGRPRVELPGNWDDVIDRWKGGAITGSEAFRELGMAKATFYRFARETV